MGPGERRNEQCKPEGLQNLQLTLPTLSYLPYVYFKKFVWSFIKREQWMTNIMNCIAKYIALVGGFIPTLLYIHTTVKLQDCIKDINNLLLNA